MPDFPFPPDLQQHLQLSSPSELQRPNRSLPAPSQLFVLYNRLLHQLFVLRPESRQRARDFFSAHGLRTRSAAAEAVRLRKAGAQASFSGIGSIACHVRRTDKFYEAALLNASAYVREAERIVASDSELYASFPPLPAELRGRCGGHTRQVHLLLASDDLNITAEFTRAQPCFRYLSLPRPADIRQRTGEEALMQMSSRERVSSTQHLMAEMVLLSESDYVILTLLLQPRPAHRHQQRMAGHGLGAESQIARQAGLEPGLRPHAGSSSPALDLHSSRVHTASHHPALSVVSRRDETRDRSEVSGE